MGQCLTSSHGLNPLGVKFLFATVLNKLKVLLLWLSRMRKYCGAEFIADFCNYYCYYHHHYLHN